MTTIYDVILYPEGVLREVAKPVGNIDASVKAQGQKMLATMYESAGIGLAANQVGLLNRVFVMDVPSGCWAYRNDTDKILHIESAHRDENAEPQSNAIVMVNPQIVKKSDRLSVYQEGCLSLPQQYADVERPAHITVEYLDLDGNKQVMEASGLESHCIQHELDHLNGVLFIDYLSRLKRGAIIRKLEKYKKDQELL